MKTKHIVLILSTLAATGALTKTYVGQNHINYTCSGTYHTEVNYPGVILSGEVNISSSVARGQRVYNNIEGAIDLNGKTYHLSREIAWKYEILSHQAGLMRITPLYETISENDTAKGTLIDTYITGKENRGRVVRSWKLNDNVVLVGNPWAPIYSCKLVK